MSKDKNHRV